jgi:hypothetical protein
MDVMVLQLSSFLLHDTSIVELVMQNPDNGSINDLPVDMV